MKSTKNTQEERVREIATQFFQDNLGYFDSDRYELQEEIIDEIKKYLISYGTERFADGKKVGWNKGIEKARRVCNSLKLCGCGSRVESLKERSDGAEGDLKEKAE